MQFFTKALALLLLITSCAATAKATEGFTVFLVRHAEKQKNIEDPGLTPCGEQRAQWLAEFFSQSTLDRVYSSNYRRTRDTAQPTTQRLGIPLTSYDATT